MGQGRADRDGAGGTKTAPVSKAVSPSLVSQVGLQYGRATSKTLYAGKGYKAPPTTTTSNPKGSQGKH